MALTENTTEARFFLARADNDERTLPQRLDDLDRARGVIEAEMEATVYRMREAGESWATIGSSMGVTRQAAQQRYGAAPA